MAADRLFFYISRVLPWKRDLQNEHAWLEVPGRMDHRAARAPPGNQLPAPETMPRLAGSTPPFSVLVWANQTTEVSAYIGQNVPSPPRCARENWWFSCSGSVGIKFSYTQWSRSSTHSAKQVNDRVVNNSWRQTCAGVKDGNIGKLVQLVELDVSLSFFTIMIYLSKRHT